MALGEFERRVSEHRRSLFGCIDAIQAEITRRYSKDEILKLYLDRAYMGGGNFGVAAASEFYFGKPVQELTPLTVLGSRFHGIAPATTVRIVKTVVHFLPKAPGLPDDSVARPGRESAARLGVEIDANEARWRGWISRSMKTASSSSSPATARSSPDSVPRYGMYGVRPSST